MSAKDRLRELQAALERRGVKDVKFFFQHGRSGLGKLTTDVADVLDTVIRQNFEPLPKLGDSVRS